MSPVTRHPTLSHWGAYTALVQDGRLVACEPFPHDPAPSSLIHAMPAMVHSPLRVRRPAVREGWLRNRDTSGRGSDRYVEISWERALRLVHEELQRVRAQYGPHGVFGGSYGWASAGRVHSAITQTHRFLHAGGGCVEQAGNYSWGAAQFLLPHVIGTYKPLTGRVTDWNSVSRHTELLVAFGGMPLRNAQMVAGGAGAHTTEHWLRRTAERGARFVIVSPTRGDVPPWLDADWIPIRPNTDAAMMIAMAHTLLAESRHDETFLHTHCTGYAAYAAYLRGDHDGQPKDADWAQAICGVPAATIRALARTAAGCRTLINCTWSLQRAHRGEQPYWASIALAAMLGQIGLPGGGFSFGTGSINSASNPRPDVAGPDMPELRNPAPRAIPVARIADMLLAPGAEYQFNGRTGIYPDVRLVYWAGGNPFHHHQDLNRLARAWRKPETIVVHESWWTPTAKRADIVLPATTTLERRDIGGSTRDRYVFAMHQALPPQGESRNDFDIYRELAAMGGFEATFTEGRDEMAWIRHVYASMAERWRKGPIAMPEPPSFDQFWQQGYLELPRTERDFILFEDFRQDPAAHPLQTPSGRIELYSEKVAGFGYEDCPPHPCWLPPAEWLGAPAARQWPLHLITSQPADRLHSQLDPAPQSRRHKIRDREPVRINPDDAAGRGIKDGMLVRVFNARGACLAGAVLDIGVSPGVLVMSTGAWFDPGEAVERHGNPNVLTLDIGTSQLSQGTSALSALVDVEPWTGPVPDMRAYESPVVSRGEDPRGEIWAGEAPMDGA
ncbi:molybdopterin-dependent oxidoreductase [Achromobacter aloeverae]|uniref:Asp-tRNA(Asn)/Glu-tRNA(Gln) amidotransferase GatCAB subunit C n=1 Tax=Achromobacter aloeverae TaxID=1750518 RepID=A0A4Q1HKC1_9BURK|nr:molybdopterin-dependent oxidoreductase [Achromobacter aloeverae]RXN88193.1 Asp-tRNA(Asn)/Glu-tRNA(Gln) amidotransferase GatCAB subunit C [Achromobacter aloeverae]